MLFGGNKDMFVIAGLGNPENKYDNTRHNIGFDAIDAIAEKYDITLGQGRGTALWGRGQIGGRKVLLMKPLTYMNLSGQAVVSALNYFKADVTKDFLVICDDIHLDTGRIRIRERGSDGGHNGLANIIKLTGTQDFARLRMGVGEKPSDWDQVDWVLGHFSAEDRHVMDEACKRVAEAVELIVAGDIPRAMSKYNAGKAE